MGHLSFIHCCIHRGYLWPWRIQSLSIYSQNHKRNTHPQAVLRSQQQQQKYVKAGAVFLSQLCHLLKLPPPRLLLPCHLGSTRSLCPVIPSTAPSHLFPIFHFANIYGACGMLPALFWAIGREQGSKETKNPSSGGLFHWKDLIDSCQTQRTSEDAKADLKKQSQPISWVVLALNSVTWDIRFSLKSIHKKKKKKSIHKNTFAVRTTCPWLQTSIYNLTPPSTSLEEFAQGHLRCCLLGLKS